jgi:DMSO/TMAO reductase YedYZ molybdopterin-dependent catalytic subunit
VKLFGKKADLPEEVQKRIPPGQYLTEKWPVLHYGPIPPFDPKRWDFRVWGEVESEVRLTWDEFQKLDQTTVQADMHCVTTWSKLDQKWEGIPFKRIVELAKPKPSAKFVISHCEYGFTANVPIDATRGDDVLIALRANGAPLAPEHGYPARLVIPKLYAWKSAKWLRGIEFRANDSPGFWEKNGYHNTGDPWREQRYWGDQ